MPLVAVTDRRCVERRVGRLLAIGALAAVLAGGVVLAEAQVPLVLAETPDEQEGSLSDVGPSNTDVAPKPVAPVDTAPSPSPVVSPACRT